MVYRLLVRQQVILLKNKVLNSNFIEELKMNRLSTLFLIGLTALSCKQKKHDESDAKTLDNFAKGEHEALTINNCGIEFSGDYSSLPKPVQDIASKVLAKDNESKNVALGVLTSVPGLLLDIFFKSGGEVIIGDEALSVCKDTPFSAGERELASSSGVIPSCWHQDKPGIAPKIYISNDPKLIHHSLVRLFAYMYTEFFVARISDQSSPSTFQTPEWKEKLESFLAVRSDLAEAFLRDLKQGKYSTFDSLNKFRQKDANRFGNYVFAEALDSYYCSDETRATFQSQFPQTYKIFTDSTNPNAPSEQFGNMERDS